MANAQTRASKKWNEKVGYIAKTYKLKKDDVENFQKACEYSGESQASVLTRLMNEYAEAKAIEHFEDGAENDFLEYEDGGLAHIVASADAEDSKASNN